jgi:sulfite exporter TauE/SafE
MKNQKLPNATAVLIMGILSLLMCFCYCTGFIFGIVGLVLAKSDMKKYRENPDAYTNFQALNIGRILSIIGLILNLLVIVIMIIAISYVGFDILQHPELLEERMSHIK